MSTWPTGRALHGGADEIPLPERVAGRLWLCGKHFVAPDAEAALAELGADTVVCLNEAGELNGRYPDYVAWLRANQPARALWWPIPDLHAPSLEDAVALLAEVRGRLDGGGKVLLHCGAGIGRAGTVAAGLLVTLGLTVADAVAHVGAHRPMAGPEAGVQAELLDALAARTAEAGRA
ncbi:hypothetical protein K6U06_23665 [Acidiferrimicrobium sp. IK]|uniref:protein-tyrosine phosphatase family protein n=1 Tax=Acidiferrimicrobium sp. IK TaxID=2871700 RepID=UPI0021CB225A|nr:hypothetical protein [Acidiferrimicrobium sp. IK]MCU4187378.1 hypothetical protein [Acidiferrimicrobium sp. IK]